VSRTAEGKEHGEMESENTVKRKRKTVSGLDEDGYEYLLTKLYGEITGLGFQVGSVLKSYIYF
jgi:hypothetical protein